MFVAIEVWSRLWRATVTGRRSYRKTLALLRGITDRMDLRRVPLIVTNGFEFYEKVVGLAATGWQSHAFAEADASPLERNIPHLAGDDHPEQTPGAADSSTATDTHAD